MLYKTKKHSAFFSPKFLNRKINSFGQYYLLEASVVAPINVSILHAGLLKIIYA